MSQIISKKVLVFLDQLEANNNRDWFNENKANYKHLQTDVKLFYNTIYNGLKMHDDLDRFKMFRIYRDVRFSKNKAPYKAHFSASFYRNKPQLRGGYYIQIKPNNKSFIATGFWDPNKEDLLRIRKEFETDDQEIRDILADKSFKAVWGNTITGDELKTAPRGFDKLHPAIDLIKKKQFILTKSYTDEAVLSKYFLNDVDESFKAVRPFFDYMSDVLTTNLNGESLI